MASPYIAWFNGKFMTEDRIQIPCTDRGLLYGDGLFETMRSIGGKIIAFRAHMERLRMSCTEVRMTSDQSDIDCRTVIGELLKKNNLPDAHIRLTLTRGTTDRFGFGFSETAKPSRLIQIRPVTPIPESIHEKGVKVVLQIAPWLHRDGQRPRVKSTSALENVLAKQQALDENAYDTLFIDDHEIVFEGSSSNVFIVSGGQLLTPPTPSGILPGITRARVLQLADRSGISAAERFFSKKELLGASEVFLTNTNVDVLPVTRCGSEKISDGAVGPVTKQLLKLYRHTLPEILQ